MFKFISLNIDSFITVLDNSTDIPVMINLKLIKVDQLEGGVKNLLADSFTSWFHFDLIQPRHIWDINRYRYFLAYNDNKSLEHLYVVLSNSHQLEGYINLHIRNVCSKEIAPWNRIKYGNVPRYIGVGSELIDFGLRILLNKFGDELLLKQVGKIMTLGFRENKADFFNENNVTTEKIKQFLKKQSEIRQSLVAKYGLAA